MPGAPIGCGAAPAGRGAPGKPAEHRSSQPVEESLALTRHAVSHPSCCGCSPAGPAGGPLGMPMPGPAGCGGLGPAAAGGGPPGYPLGAPPGGPYPAVAAAAGRRQATLSCAPSPVMAEITLVLVAAPHPPCNCSSRQPHQPAWAQSSGHLGGHRAAAAGRHQGREAGHLQAQGAGCSFQDCSAAALGGVWRSCLKKRVPAHLFAAAHRLDCSLAAADGQTW